MADDLVINVKQISQYPPASATGGSDRLLLQQGGLGGPYLSIAPTTLLATALDQGGWISFAPGAGGLAWNGAAFTFDGASFIATEPLSAPEIFVGGIAVANQDWVTALFDTIALAPRVSSFNGRTGDVQLEVADVMRAGAAPIWDPHFGGHVTAPTSWNLQAEDDTVATLAWVQEWARCSGNVVHTFNGRGGDVVLDAADVSAALTVPGVFGYANTAPSGDTSKRIANTMFVDDAMANVQQWAIGMFTTYGEIFSLQYAPLNSPNFTGLPTAPTANPGTNTGQLATTAYVMAAVAASVTGVATWNGRTGDVVLDAADITAAGGALLVSPAFSGVPTAPTAAGGTASTQLATCAFVQNAVNAISAGVVSFNTRTGAVVLQSSDVTAVGGALLASPAFSGTPTAPTPPGASNNTSIATTAWVTTALSNVTAGVSSFNGRTGAVSLLGADVSAAGGALIASPTFTGSPAAPTPAPGNNSTLIATTAFVQNAVAASTAGVSSFNGRTGAVVFGAGDITAAGGALLAGPTFTGIPSAPTAAANTNTTQLATTAFVQTALAAAPGGVSSFNTRTGAITLQGADVSAAGGALTNSPAFTGTPTAPTQTATTNNTTLATTAFVQAALATAGGVVTFNARAGAVTLNATDIFNANGAVYRQSDSAPSATPNTFWFDSVGGQLYVRYVDPVTSVQSWVIANSPVAQPTPPPQSGTRVLLRSADVTSATAAIQWLGTGIGDGSYDVYEVEFWNVQTSASAAIYMTFSFDGSTFVTTGGPYATALMYPSSTTGSMGASYTGNQNFMQLTSSQGTQAQANSSGFAKLFNLGILGVIKWVQAYTSNLASSGVIAGTFTSWYNLTPWSIVRGIQIAPSSGTFTVGSFRLYGIAK